MVPGGLWVLLIHHLLAAQVGREGQVLLLGVLVVLFLQQVLVDLVGQHRVVQGDQVVRAVLLLEVLEGLGVRMVLHPEVLVGLEGLLLPVVQGGLVVPQVLYFLLDLKSLDYLQVRASFV